MNAGTTWRLLRKFWVDFYGGAPDYIFTHAKTNLNSAEFENRSSLKGSLVKIVSTVAQEHIELMERSHAYFRKVLEKLRIDLPHISRESFMSVAFRAINNAPISDSGIPHTTFHFGVYPKIRSAVFRGTFLQCASIVREYTFIVTEMKIKRTICDAMMRHNTASCPKTQKHFPTSVRT